MSRLRIGTRASALATTQTGHIADRLRALGADVEIVPISTEGDRSSEPLASMGGQGVFVAALREALAAGEVDAAVHSLKDLPTYADDRLTLAAIPVREDPRDVLIARDGLTLGELPQGARVGTGSPRREAQLNALGLSVEVVPIRGNVDTRIGKVTSGIAGAANVDTAVSQAMPGVPGIHVNVASDGSIAPSIGHHFDDDRHFGAGNRQPQGRGYPRAVRKLDPERINGLDAERKL